MDDGGGMEDEIKKRELVIGRDTNDTITIKII